MCTRLLPPIHGNPVSHAFGWRQGLRIVEGTGFLLDLLSKHSGDIGLKQQPATERADRMPWTTSRVVRKYQVIAMN